MSTSSSFASGSNLNRGPAVLITSWALIGLSATFVFARAAARRKLTKIESGDILLPLSLVLAFGQTALIQLAVNNGLGEPYGSIGAQAVQAYYEISYWAQLLYILVLGLTKTSVVLLVTTLRPQRGVRIGCWIASAVIVASTLACLLVSAFQCQLPYPWQLKTQKCIDLAIFWNALGAINIATELMVVALPITAVYLLPVNRETRWFIGTLCSTRFLVPIFAIVQLCWLQTYISSTDSTFDIAPYQVWTQVVLNVSIVTACIPSLGGLLTELASGVTGKRITLGDIDLARYSQYNAWRLSRHSRMGSRRGEKHSKMGEIEHVRQRSSSRLGRESRFGSTSSSSRSKSRLSQFSWFRLDRSSQNYVIANNQEHLPNHVPAPLRSYNYYPEKHYDIGPAPLPPAPAVLTHKSKGSVTFDVLDDYADTRSITVKGSSTDNSPRKSTSTQGRWSILISNAAKIPPPTHDRGISGISHSTSGRGTSISSTVIHSHNNSTSSITRAISSPSFLYSSAPVIPQRNPARPSTSTRPNTADSSTHRYPPVSYPTPPLPRRPNTAGSHRRGHSRNQSIHGNHGNTDNRVIRSASYRSHRSKVSDVSARSEKLSIEEAREDSPTFESQYFADDNKNNNNNKKRDEDDDFEDVDLRYDPRGRF